jgi:hypothetical protein
MTRFWGTQRRARCDFTNAIQQEITMFVSSFAKDIFAGIVRHFATFGGGCLMAHGILTNDQLNGWIGSICFLGGIAWSAWDKWQREGRL